MNPAAIVTGGSRGIGRGIAIELARLGYDLVINYARNSRAAEQTAADCVAAARSVPALAVPAAAVRDVAAGAAPVAAVGDHGSIQAWPCRADIGTAAGRQRLVSFARRHLPRLDLLVNNAGVAPAARVDLLEAGEASFDRLLRVNLKGPYFLTQQVARWMIRALPHSPRASRYQPKIITISSISAYAASTDRGDYCLAKAALSMLTRLYAARLAEYGIAVYEVRPGIIATDMTAPVKGKYDARITQGLTPIRRWGQPEDVAKAVAAIAQGLLPFSTGEVINVDGGFHLRTL